MSLNLSADDAYALGCSEGYEAARADSNCHPHDGDHTFRSFNAWDQYLDGWYTGVWEALEARDAEALDSNADD